MGTVWAASEPLSAWILSSHLAFLAGGGHKDLCLLDSQLLERLIGGASIDGMSCSLDKDSDGGVGGTAGTPALQSNQSPTKEYFGQPSNPRSIMELPQLISISACIGHRTS